MILSATSKIVRQILVPVFLTFTLIQFNSCSKPQNNVTTESSTNKNIQETQDQSLKNSTTTKSKHKLEAEKLLSVNPDLEKDIKGYIEAEEEMELVPYGQGITKARKNSLYTLTDDSDFYLDPEMKIKKGTIKKGTTLILFQLNQDRKKAFITMKEELDPSSHDYKLNFKTTGWIDYSLMKFLGEKINFFQSDDVLIEILGPYRVITYKDKIYYQKISLHMYSVVFNNVIPFSDHYLYFGGYSYDVTNSWIFNLYTGEFIERVYGEPIFSPDGSMVAFIGTTGVIGDKIDIKIYKNDKSGISLIFIKNNALKNPETGTEAIWISETGIEVLNYKKELFYTVSLNDSVWETKEIE